LARALLRGHDRAGSYIHNNPTSISFYEVINRFLD
jgi:hypothetical protein